MTDLEKKRRKRCDVCDSVFLGVASSGVLSCDESSYPVDEASGEEIEDKRVPFGETLSLFLISLYFLFCIGI